MIKIMKIQKGFVGVFVTIIIALGLLGGGYYYVVNQNVLNSTQSPLATTTTSSNEVSDTAATPPPTTKTPQIQTKTNVNITTSSPLDYNNDGLENSTDVTFLSQIALGNQTCPVNKTCDLNNDTKVTEADAVALTNAIAGAGDAQIKMNLSSIRAYAEIFYSGNYTYGLPGTNPDVCIGADAPSMFKDTKSDFAGALQDITTTKGCNVSADGKSYAVWAANSQGYWCIDSGYSSGKQIKTRPILGATKCP